MLVLIKRRRRKKKVHYISFPYVTWIVSAFIVDVLKLSLLLSVIVHWVAVEYFQTSLSNSDAPFLSIWDPSVFLLYHNKEAYTSEFYNFYIFNCTMYYGKK